MDILSLLTNNDLETATTIVANITAILLFLWGLIQGVPKFIQLVDSQIKSAELQSEILEIERRRDAGEGRNPKFVSTFDRPFTPQGRYSVYLDWLDLVPGYRQGLSAEVFARLTPDQVDAYERFVERCLFLLKAIFDFADQSSSEEWFDRVLLEVEKHQAVLSNQSFQDRVLRELGPTMRDAVISVVSRR